MSNVPQSPDATTTSQPTAWGYLSQMMDWINNPSTFIFGRWQGHPEGGFEGGMDLGSPGGTPVYALATGYLQGNGNFCHGGPFQNASEGCSNGAPGYGVLTQRVNVPGYGTQDIYYQHIALDPSFPICGSGNCGSVLIQKGQRIGTIKDNVGMLEIGFNADWGSIWGANHPAPWADDPRPMVKALMLDTSPSIAPANGTTGSTSASTATSLLDFASIAPQLKSWGEYAAIFILALAFLIIGITLLGGHPVQVAQNAVTTPINYVKQRRAVLKSE